MAKSKTAKKKNHVSKHILKARDDGAPTEAADGTSPAPPANRKPKRNKGNASGRVKHPDEAHSYLAQWKASRSEDSSAREASAAHWKFNKNTQSWLIRHMYEVEKVPKATFALLLEYLEGLEGKTILDRMRSEASRRCRRHKEYCKNNPEGGDNKGGRTETESRRNDEDKDNDGGGDGDGDEQTGSKTTTTAPGTPSVSSEDLEYEEALWKKLDDHEKRKQYKRARKILDLVKNSNNSKEDSD